MMYGPKKLYKKPTRGEYPRVGDAPVDVRTRENKLLAVCLYVAPGRASELTQRRREPPH